MEQMCEERDGCIGERMAGLDGSSAKVQDIIKIYQAYTRDAGKADKNLGTQAATFRDAAVQKSRMYIYAMNMPPSSQSVGSCCCEGTRRGDVRDSHSL